MVAMNDLARQIADKNPGPRSSEHAATVVGKDAQGTYWVSIPGGAEKTPVATALVEASAGDTVMVAISGGRCIMSGNVSSPGASTRSVSKVGAVANMAMTTAYSEKARIDELSATALTARSALITDLQADTAKVHDLTAEQIGAATAYVGTLSAGDVTAQDIIAAQGTIESLDSNYAHITNGVIDNAAIGHADVSGLSANYAHITSGVIDNATIGHADVNGLAANYAEIDGANIDTAAIRDAWVDNLLVSTGLLANDGTVFTLDAVQVDAANIMTGTLDVRRLIITRTEGGVDQKYLVEIDSTTGNPSYVKMDGDVLGPHTVSADKLVAHSITASEITTQNLAGTNGWINLASGTFAYGNPLTGQGITWNGSALEIQGSVHVGGSSKQLADMLTSNDITVSQNQTQTGYDVDIAGNTFSLVNGSDGARILGVTTAPASYTTTTGGFKPTYRIALSTVLTQSGASEVRVGDVLLYSYYEYPVGYVDSSYVYTGARKSIRGASGSSVTISSTEYQEGTSATTAPTGTWGSSPVQVAEGNYLWTKITYSTGTVAYSVAKQGETGPQGVSVTNVTSTNNTSDGGTSVVTVTLSDGTTKTFNVKNGSKGSTGDTAQWYYGTALTHTSGTATLATSSTSGVVVGSMYLNTATSLCYKCTAISGTTATWTYAGNLTDGVIDNINVGGRNYVSALTENWVQKTVSESSAAGTAWTSMQGTSTTRISTKELVPVSGSSIVVSAASGFDVFVTFFDANGYMHSYLGWANSRVINLSSYSGCTHVGLTVRKADNTTAITPSEAIDAKVKLEIGNVATDWTPAPEDMVTASEVGALEPPYTEVEWVESNGKQYVYLDWKPSSATWGFEADFIVRNAFSTTASTWDASANANGYGTIFGVRNASKVNDFHLSTYNTTGTLCYGNNKEYKTSGILKTDGTRQTVSFLGTTITRGDGTTVTVSRGTDAANKPYSNMAVFATYNGNRKKVSGDLVNPGSVRIYSLKFYENTTLKVDLVGAVRKKDGVTGLYDKVAGKFYPAPSMTYGGAVGDLGVAPTVAEALNRATPHVTVDNATNTRMWQATCPELDKLEDGQEINVTPMYTVTKSYQTTELAGWDDTSEDTYVYMKLALANGSTTEWIPCYYMSTTRLTTHYGAGNTIRMTYRENMLVSATATTAGSSIMRGFYCDPNYDTTYNLGNNLYYNTILAKSAITAESIIVGDSSGYAQAASGVTFDLSYPILWTKVAFALNGTGHSDLYTSIYDRNLKTNYSSFQGTAKAIVYLVGTVSGNTFTIDPSVLTSDVPDNEDGKFYIPIGRHGNQYIYASKPAYFFFECPTTPSLYAFLDGEFRQVTPTEIVATQRIYWRTATSGTPNKPSSWVTATSDSYASWTTKVPPLSSDGTTGASKYPYLYTCEQRKRLDGTVECTAVLLDDSTTIIDGGNIITNSITANKLDTVDLNVSHAITIGAFDYETSNTINDAAANATQALQDASDAAKTATNFITESGVNDMLLTAGPQAYRVRLTSAGMEILNPDGDVVGFHGSTIQLGSTDGIYFEASETRLAFRTLTQEIAYFGLNSDGIWQMHIATTNVDDMIRFGDYAWIKRDNGNMSIKWLGE